MLLPPSIHRDIIKDEEDGTALVEERTAENLSGGSPDVVLLSVVQHFVNSVIAFSDDRNPKPREGSERKGRCRGKKKKTSFGTNESWLRKRVEERGGRGIDRETDPLSRGNFGASNSRSRRTKDRGWKGGVPENGVVRSG